MLDLAAEGLLTEELVEAMDAEPDDERLAEYRFPIDRHPFTHQLAAWRLLKQEEPQSVLITSGTGSGKTEGFLVPILDHLARQRREQGRLRGVRALFLYPLNALINSQRDRLRAWSRPLQGDLRFCLYKGDTPQRSSAAARARMGREEVPDRVTLRSDPPPLLVTNSTMLEYMLVRAEDQPIIRQSQGLLGWVVLDEAHTYLGSQAAEMALLLRRVLHAFSVSPTDVRFVATSATIGTESTESMERLQRFLADLAGVPLDRVHVVRGHRLAPTLPGSFTRNDDPLPTFEDLRIRSKEGRGAALASSDAARRVREALLQSGTALTLSQLTAARLGTEEGSSALSSRQETLQLIDLATEADVEGEPFLRVRGHLFHRTQGGLWACLNTACVGRRETPLDDFEWAYGKIFFERHEECDVCTSRVLPLVLCSECGKEYLAATLVANDDGHRVVSPPVGAYQEEDEFEELLDFDQSEDEDAPTVASGDWPQRLFAHPATPGLRPIHIEADGSLVAGDGGTESLPLGEVMPEPAERTFRCPECGTKGQLDRLFRPFRGGSSFMLRSVVPVVLDYTPPLDNRKKKRLPSDGRRLLTFTDSRQGTARFALDAQLDAERNYSRSLVYHLVIAARSDEEAAQADVEKLRETVAALGSAVEASPALQDTLDEKRRQLHELTSPRLGKLRWTDVVQRVAQEREIESWMRRHWRHLPLSDLRPTELAQLLLLREFARRPKRQNSLETLGFVALEYSGIGEDPTPPPPWQRRQLPREEWRNFLKIAVDFGVRARRSVQVTDRLIPWMGVPLRPQVLVGPEADAGDRQVRWSLSKPLTRRSRLVQLLARLLDVDPGSDPEGEGEINDCLLAAWRQVRRILTTTQEGSLLDLSREAALREVRDCWLCPVTRRVLDTAVCGLTPHVTPALTRSDLEATPIRMPRAPVAFWRTATDAPYSREEIEEAIRSDPDILALREMGVWQGLSDRVYAQSAYFQVAEHSAQLDATRLEDLETHFRKGTVNVLSCSTTMEMGVDIGGLSAVAMTNAPPSPANYLQRAGRAGRRQESRAFGLTLCNTAPHGEWVFRDPLWPFHTPLHVTEVSLGSERIVQRHVHALTLTRYFGLHFSGEQVHRLTAGWFFEATSDRSAVSDRFGSWLLQEAPDDEWVQQGLERLLSRSALEGVGVAVLLGDTHARIREIGEAWRAELDPLTVDLAQLKDKPENEPARLAIELQLRRLREEYLLRELALRNFFPGYGFPTQVVPFVTTTGQDLDRRRRKRQEAATDREDNRLRGRNYPTRDISQALRDYAPGSNVVLDGRVLKSSGLTLNWKIPATDAGLREVQALRWAWRCPHCGTVGVSARQPESCTSDFCAGRSSELRPRPFIEPAGFAVDIRDRLTNDLTRWSYQPVQQPWIAAAGEQWQSLTRPELGRFRYSPQGHVFSYSKGEHGHGYSICLQCGRAAAEEERIGGLPSELENHKPLRGGAAAREDGLCRGNDSDWRIRRNHWLSKETDVFELQLRTAENHDPLGPEAAASIAVALRQALSVKIGVEDREIGWSYEAARVVETGEQNVSILLYDKATGGAGFVAQTSAYLPELLQSARAILQCPRECDKACHACLLTYDTHHHADVLNRKLALEVLTDTFFAGFKLPPESQVFGPDTQMEFEPISTAIHREMRASDSIRLHTGGRPSEWSLEDWPLQRYLAHWAMGGTPVELVLPRDTGTLPIEARALLATWSDALGIDLLRAEKGSSPSDAHLLVEISGGGRSTRFAVPNEKALTPGPDWGASGGSAHVVRAHSEIPPASLDRVDAATLRSPPPGSVAAVVLTDSLDGPVSSFGTAFWDEVLAATPDLERRLDEGIPIREVVYQDRYVRGPLSARLLAEVVEDLGSRAGSGAAEAEYRLLVTPPHGSRRSVHWVWDDWRTGREAGEVMEELFAAKGMSLDVTLGDLRRVKHPRELRVTWEDGRRWRCRLDQGFGFMRAADQQAHPFEESPKRQGHVLATATFDVMARDPGYLYVYPVE